MRCLAVTAYFKLFEFDLYIYRRDFARLHNRVRSSVVNPHAALPGTVERICSAVNLACMWYWKPVRCLQRSAVTTCLLRQGGVWAQMVIGAQQLPLKAHAWVEIDGRVINDKPYTREMYAVLDRL